MLYCRVMATIFLNYAHRFYNKDGVYSLVVLNESGVKIGENSVSMPNSTSNQVELSAVIEALERARQFQDEKVVIRCKNSYICECINKKWYLSWKKGKPENEDLWIKIADLMKSYITFQHISENTENEWVTYTNDLTNTKLCEKFEIKNR